MDKNVPSHKSVMMNEVLEILNPKSNETYIDCTLVQEDILEQFLKAPNVM